MNLVLKIVGLVLVLLVWTALSFGGGCVCTWAAMTNDAPSSTMPLPSKGGMAGEVVQCRRLEVLDEKGNVQFYVTAQGGKPMAAVSDEKGNKMEADLRSLIRTARRFGEGK